MGLLEKSFYRGLDEGTYGSEEIQEMLALLFHENSKFDRFSGRESGQKIGAFSHPYFTKRYTQPFKRYPYSKLIDLRKYEDFGLPKKDLFEILNQRQSIRFYDEKYKVSEYELYTILSQAYGVNRWLEIQDPEVEGHMGMRNVPSAGGLYPLEIYICLFNSHLEPGLYHFRPDINSLEELKLGQFLPHLNEIIYAKDYIDTASAAGVIFTTSLIERMALKYGERGYRFILQECGFVGQNLSLLCETIDFGSCMVGGYLDDKVNEFLEVDGVYECIQSALFFGKKPQQA